MKGGRTRFYKHIKNTQANKPYGIKEGKTNVFYNLVGNDCGIRCG